MLLFSTIDVSRQIFFRSGLSFAIVNLKPIVPGHVLVIPNRVVPRLADLKEDELSSLFSAVQTVGKVVEKAYGADGLTIACQDGSAAGQSIPHVHIHVLPRKFLGDRFQHANDDVYPAIEQSEGELGRRVQPLQVDNEGRPPRSAEEMETEAKWLSDLFQKS
ncbi:HIT-like protein [Sistotremastrum niveocremeum HHB9708]|uniref:HIT-like protein n=1 Tax=Sistotremastrum niveocremeum HHB9708 TaxID=1314777 RepID=A0A164UFM5_9AGAM|nr:HIT-like protein [Sistotremastrum niveocremeum HHB9708]